MTRIPHLRARYIDVLSKQICLEIYVKYSSSLQRIRIDCKIEKSNESPGSPLTCTKSILDLGLPS